MMEGTKDKVGWALGVTIVVMSVAVVITVGVIYGTSMAFLTIMHIPLAIVLLWILAATIASVVEIIHDIFVDTF